MKGCRMCKRTLPQEPTLLEYGGGETLQFCHIRCRRDWLDKLPPGSLIKQGAGERHKLAMIPWGLEDEGILEPDP